MTHFGTFMHLCFGQSDTTPCCVLLASHDQEGSTEDMNGTTIADSQPGPLYRAMPHQL